jgi:glutamate dehydrogenase (NAD(P)+)
VAIQGCGNAGGIAAQLFYEAGARIIAISDSQGGIHQEQGFDPAALLNHKVKTGSVLGLAGTREISNDQLLSLDCDVLIPAAMENQIRKDNAELIRARLICEAANGPTTPAADQLLFERGIPIVPDILANSGGVCVSYFEWVQNIENEQWDLEEVNHKLQTKMVRATNTVIDKQAQINQSIGGDKNTKNENDPGPIDLRTAALIVAIERVSNVALERGIWP